MTNTRRRPAGHIRGVTLNPMSNHGRLWSEASSRGDCSRHRGSRSTYGKGAGGANCRSGFLGVLSTIGLSSL